MQTATLSIAATDLTQYCNYRRICCTPDEGSSIATVNDSSVQQYGFTPLWLNQMHYFSHCNLSFTFSLPCGNRSTDYSSANFSNVFFFVVTVADISRNYITSINVTIPHFQQFSYCQNQFALYFAGDLGFNSITGSPLSNSVQCTTETGLFNFALEKGRLIQQYISQCHAGVERAQIRLTMETVASDQNTSLGQTNVPLSPGIELVMTAEGYTS